MFCWSISSFVNNKQKIIALVTKPWPVDGDPWWAVEPGSKHDSWQAPEVVPPLWGHEDVWKVSVEFSVLAVLPRPQVLGANPLRALTGVEKEFLEVGVQQQSSGSENEKWFNLIASGNHMTKNIGFETSNYCKVEYFCAGNLLADFYTKNKKLQKPKLILRV